MASSNGVVDVPKKGIVGQTYEQGARRELTEETKIKGGRSVRNLSELGRISHNLNNFATQVRAFAAEIDPNPEYMLGADEAEDPEILGFRFISISEIHEMIRRNEIIDGDTLSTLMVFTAKLADLKQPQNIGK